MADLTEDPAPVPTDNEGGYPPPPEYNDTVQELAPEDVPVLSDAEADALAAQQEENQRILAEQATEVEPGPGTGYPDATTGAQGFAVNPDAESEAAAAAFVGKNLAQTQATLQARVNQPSSADWRVRIQLATGADYLYKSSQPGILKPLAGTDGVIFPYTPTIDTAYQAKYAASDLTHSNYKGYFYQSSSVDNLTVKGTFTAQDTREAQYLLAVITFFRSVTKMFYGQDAQAGAPPPLVYLSGFGQYQFNRLPCVVSNFTYNLPADVDYIRADGFNNYGVNMENRRSQSSGPGPGGGLGAFLLNKLNVNGLRLGGISNPPAPPPVSQNVNNTNAVNSTYVPTKMEISVTLLPMQTRNQVSQQFSLKRFANGDLIKGGFW